MRSPLPIKRSLSSKRKQKGAVAIVVGLSLVTLFAMGGVVLDLGHLYIAKSELQNAADAAALAGAVRLNHTAASITNARNDAIAIAARNNFNFSTNVTLVEANINYGSSPSGPWSDYATALASPTGKTFVRVNTGSQTMDTYLMRVVSPAFNTVSTFGLAVAGRFVNDVTPIAICAIQNAAGVSRPKGEVLPGTNELAQFGFRRGVSYNIFELGPVGSPSNPYLINPIDVYPGAGAPSTCNPPNGNPAIGAPFVCNGSSAVLTTTPGTVYGNSGFSVGPIFAALNSRFNDYSSPSVCIPAKAPPDINVKKYAFGLTSVVDWMNPQPTVQTMRDPGMPIPPASIASADKYGVLWSYSRAVRAVGDPLNPTPGTAFATTDWGTLYPPAPATDTDFPATGSPYLDSSNSSHFVAPTVNAGVANRRVLNLAIANCPAVTGTGNCQEVPILGVGRFFMQVPAVGGGSLKKLEVEFAGLIEPIPVSEIRLYR